MPAFSMWDGGCPFRNRAPRVRAFDRGSGLKRGDVRADRSLALCGTIAGTKGAARTTGRMRIRLIQRMFKMTLTSGCKTS